MKTSIKLFIMDVDGTLTDGKIYIGNNGEIFKAFNVKDGSADLCFIINTPLNEAKNHIESLGVKIEEGIVSRTGAMGEIEFIYLRDPDKNLIELSNYKSK